MKTWKLVSGILSILLFFLVAFQSCAAGISNALLANGEKSGSGGILLAVMMLVGGIVSIATRQQKENGANIALCILFGIGALAGFVLAGSFSDLNIWASWCTVNAALAVISIVKEKKENV